MGKTREIKKRIKAVGNIKRITRTMQMIATSKFSKALARATATKPYTEGVYNLVTELAQTAGNLDHPLISGPATGFRPGAKELTLLITSDRGLCGPYNGNILRVASNHFKAVPDARAGRIELIGKKGANFLKYNNIPVVSTHKLGDTPTFAQVEKLAQEFMDRFISGEVSAVRVIYMRFISAGRQTPEILNLLPLKPPAAAANAAPKAGPSLQYEFSPSAPELLAELLPSTVKASLFQAVSDAIVSEHVARMIAMKAATDNAGSMGKDLTRVYNRARQAQITTELTEIISGAAALE